MEKLVIYNNGVASLDLAADYKGLKLRTYDQPPPDYFILNSNNTMSVLKQIKTTDNYEHLWILSMLLDKRINGKLTAEISLFIKVWCSKCRADVTSYKFDMNYKFYKAIETGISHKCVRCTEESLRFYNHPKFSMNYAFTKYGDNYVHRNFYNGNIEYTILTDDQYTMFKFNTYDINYHPIITHRPEQEDNKIRCTVCGKESVDYWRHNESCIKNINNFASQIYPKNNLLMRNLDCITDDVKNLITDNLIIIVKAKFI
jgi:hypothetical protein